MHIFFHGFKLTFQKLLCVLMVLVSVNSEANFQSARKYCFDIKFGILERVDNNHYRMVKNKADEDQLISLKDHKKIYGIQITPETKASYKCFIITYLPHAPKVLTGELSAGSPDDYLKGIRSSEISLSGVLYLPLTFDESDPIGMYKIDVFVDGKLSKSIMFNVTQ